MSYLNVSQADREMAPFRIERFLREEKPNHFVPEARLVVRSSLRTCGLLAILTDEAVCTLLALLSHVSPNGALRPTVSGLASVLGLSDEAVRDRLRRMSAIIWKGEPLLLVHPTESGLEMVTPSPHVINAIEGDINEVTLPPGYSWPPPQTEEPTFDELGPSVRERIVAHSREKYARPREEVERDVLRQLGHYAEEVAEGPVGDVWRRLVALGIPGSEVEPLMAAHPLEEITCQLDWLKYRDARNSARYVVAAIEGRYAAPARARWEQAMKAHSPNEESEFLLTGSEDIVGNGPVDEVEIEEITDVDEARDLSIPPLDGSDQAGD